MEYMTVEEIAATLRLDESTIRRWCRTGILPAIQVGRQYRVARSEFDRFVAGRRIKDSGERPTSLVLAH
jgi:excisionase family DNA binding protein